MKQENYRIEVVIFLNLFFFKKKIENKKTYGYQTKP